MISTVVVIPLLSHVQLFATPWTAALQASLSSISQCLLRFMSVELVMPSNHSILCHPLLLLPSIFLSIRVFSNELALRIRWPRYWSFSFSISPSNGFSGLIPFRMDWFDFLAAQGTLIVHEVSVSLDLCGYSCLFFYLWNHVSSLNTTQVFHSIWDSDTGCDLGQ